MYCLLFAGYSMAFADEKFLLDALHHLPSDELASKDIRLILLDRDSPHWDRNAQVTVENTAALKRGGVGGFKELCSNAERQIRSIIDHAKITTHKANPAWRLYIFQDRVFVSRYARPPDSKFLSSHEVPVMAFDYGDPMYEWQCCEFRRHSPTDWRAELRFEPFESC